MKNELTPLISVIIPVYNPGKYLYKCLDSIINQTYQNLEIILIDDGSTDGSDKICEQYAKNDSRILVIHQENGGVSKARNQGLKIAQGDYIHFPDSDDYLELDTYEYVLNLMNKWNCDVVNFENFITYPKNEITHKFPPNRYGLFDITNTHKQFMNGVQFCWNKMFSRKIIINNKGKNNLFFREDIYRGEDTLFAAQAIERAERIWFDSRPLYHYVQSEESACRGKFRSTQLSILKLYDAYEPLYKEKYPDIWIDFLLFIEETVIGIYYDMWSDKKDFKNEQKNVVKILKEKYRLIKKCKMGRKRRIKFTLFLLCPNFFCLLHKIVHKL